MLWLGPLAVASTATLRRVNRRSRALNKDYVYPSRKDLAIFRGLGMNVIRVPFRWERIQRQLNAPLDPSELEQLRRVVSWAKELDLCVLLDLHNYGTFNGRAVGSTSASMLVHTASAARRNPASL